MYAQLLFLLPHAHAKLAQAWYPSGKNIIRAMCCESQLWRLRSPLAALDIRCWTGPDVHVPLPRITRGCLQRFAAMNASGLAKEYGMVNADFAESLIQRSQVVTPLWPVCQTHMKLR